MPAAPATSRPNILTSAQLQATTTPLLLVAAYAAGFGLLALFDAASWLSGLALGSALFLAAGFALSAAVEGVRKAKDRLFRHVVTGAFLLALLKLAGCVVVRVVYGLTALDDGQMTLPWERPNFLVWWCLAGAVVLSAVHLLLGRRAVLRHDARDGPEPGRAAT